MSGALLRPACLAPGPELLVVGTYLRLGVCERECGVGSSGQSVFLYVKVRGERSSQQSPLYTQLLHIQYMQAGD